MAENTKDPSIRYVMIELSCDESQCNPCTYPNCQRYVRHLPKNKKLTATIKPIASKVLEVNTERKIELEKKTDQKFPTYLNRYILTELSCQDAKCFPCTYPNCQRFVRTKKMSATSKWPVVSVTELKADKKVKDVIKKKK